MLLTLKGPASALLVAGLSCDPVLARLFTPRHPQIGRYEVCTTTEPLVSVVPDGWTIEAVEPLDAFGAAGLYDRARLAQLYGGTRPQVARGWIREADRFESLTLISPHPNAALERLLPGTMVIRFVITPMSGFQNPRLSGLPKAASPPRTPRTRRQSPTSLPFVSLVSLVSFVSFVFDLQRRRTSLGAAKTGAL